MNVQKNETTTLTGIQHPGKTSPCSLQNQKNAMSSWDRVQIGKCDSNASKMSEDTGNGSLAAIGFWQKPFADLENFEETFISKWNTEDDCTENGGEWLGFYNSKYTFTNADTEEQCWEIAEELSIWEDVVWGRDYPKNERVFNVTKETCILLEEAPSCTRAPWSRANHLGMFIR